MGVNPWLAKKIESLNSPPFIYTIVEVDKSKNVDEVRSYLKGVSGIQVGEKAFNMIHVAMPHQVVSTVGRIPGVTVHYDAPKGIRSILPSSVFGIREILNNGKFPLTFLDPLVGRFQISSIEVPLTPEQMLMKFPTLLPNRLLTPPAMLLGFLPQGLRQKLSSGAPKNPDIIITTTGDARKWLEVPEINKLKNTKVCIIDTGIGFPDPFLLHPTKGRIYMDMTIEHPNPLDGLGHGHWCITACAGDTWETDYGTCRGVCDPENGLLGSVKCLSTLGFGTSWSVIQAMEKAAKWGAKVVSMSLGGELQGSVDDDPECKIIAQLKDQVIFVVAAGNSGPNGWTIGSPGASPHCVTVGAWSTYYDGLASFSSRGPSGAWYASNIGQYRDDLKKYGSNLIKPDIVAPGGGPVLGQTKPDMIYSGCRGWMDGMNDGVPGNGFDAMRGCLAAGTQVYTPDGPVAIEDMREGNQVFSYDQGTIVIKEVLGLIPQGRREVFKVSAKGFGVLATENHPFLIVPKGAERAEFIQVQDIQEGDAIVLTKRMPEVIAPELDELISEDLSRFLGFFMGDGWLSCKSGNNMVCLADGGNAVDQAYHKLFETLFNESLKADSSMRWKYTYSRKLALILKLLGLGEYHNKISLPPWLFHLPENKRQAFIAGLVHADGADMHSGAVSSRSLELASLEAIAGVHALARYSNIRAGERRSRTRIIQAPSQSEPKAQTSFVVSLNYAPYYEGVSQTTKRRITGLDSKYFFVKKVEVESFGEAETYDISVEGAKNFMAEGFVAHNTSMATPMAAGIIALAVDQGYVKTAEDVKRRMSKSSKDKNPESGFGMVTWNKLTQG
jgi:hypothetical protein